MDDVVRDAVMIGAAAIRPVLTARTETTAAVLEKSRRQDRWERIAISAAKQCGRAVVPADPRAGHIRSPDTDSAAPMAGRARDHAGRTWRVEGRRSLFGSRCRTAEGGDRRRRSRRRMDARGDRGRCRGVPARDDGGQNAPRRCDGSRRDLGGPMPVEGVLAALCALGPCVRHCERTARIGPGPPLRRQQESARSDPRHVRRQGVQMHRRCGLRPTSR